MAAVAAVGLGLASHASGVETIVSPRITLPAGYKQLQYVTVERSGAYVDTEIVATEENDLGFEIVFKGLGTTSSRSTIPLVGSDCSNPWLYMSLVQFGGSWHAGDDNCNTNTSASIKEEIGYHDVVYNIGANRAIVVDGVCGATLAKVPISNGGHLLLLKRAGSDIVDFTGELHAFRVFSRTSGEDVANFVPVLNSEMVAGFYDTIRQRFFPATAGSFGAGTAVENYKRLERVLFSNGAYVDTGFVIQPEDDCQINLKFDAGTYLANMFILGTIGGGIISGPEVHRWVHLSLYANKYYYGCAGNKQYDLNSGTIPYVPGVHSFCYNIGDERQVLIDGSAGASLYANPSTNTRKLLIARRESTSNYTGFIYDLAITSKVTNVELVHLVPVKGCDSGELGFYDLSRQRFYRPLVGSIMSELSYEDVVPLAYAQFTKGAFLDTGLKITKDDNCRLEFKFASDVYTKDEHIIGNYAGRCAWYIHWTSWENTWYYGCKGDGDLHANNMPWVAGTHIVKFGSGSDRRVIVDGQDTGVPLPGAPTTGDATLCIGRRETTAANCVSKIYYLKVYRQSADFSTSELVMHLIPVQDPATGSVYFYDKVTDEFLMPNGSGTVNPGPKAPGMIIIFR